jgi:radical SAM superfamily enzyme YgiQ (UPF0313 family)
MGLGYLAGALLAAGYDDVTLFDAEVEEEPLASLLERERYDVVGVSSPTPLIYETWEAAAQAKEQGAITVLGGPHLTLMPDESMQRDEVDLVVRGEAEETIIEIMQAIEGMGPLDTESPRLCLPEDPWSEIPGLCYRNLSGKVVHNPTRPLPADIESIPWPAYHLFKIERYTNLQPITDGLDPHARAYTLVTSRETPGVAVRRRMWWPSGGTWSKRWAPPRSESPTMCGI